MKSKDNTKDNKSKYYQYQEQFFGIPERISLRIRRKMFDSLMKLAKPSDQTTILDVGVTCDRRQDSNFFEKFYPYTHRITAIGMEDGSFLEKDFPGLKFFKVDGTSLPFPDKSFDLAVSFATIEHVGSRQRQKSFVDELCRVSRECCFTTPNRWHPLEFHTVIPMIHWLPPRVFRWILRWIGRDFYAQEENLNLLSQKEILRMLPSDKVVRVEHFRFFGVVSNLLIFIKNPSGPSGKA